MAHWQASLARRSGGEPVDSRSEEQREFDHEVFELRQWSADRRLLAQVVNAVNANTHLWVDKDKVDRVVVGPMDWWPDHQKRKLDAGRQEKAPTSVAAFYQMFGVFEEE